MRQKSLVCCFYYYIQLVGKNYRKFRNMRISPISSYGSNSQAFAGSKTQVVTQPAEMLAHNIKPQMSISKPLSIFGGTIISLAAIFGLGNNATAQTTTDPASNSKTVSAGTVVNAGNTPTTATMATATTTAPVLKMDEWVTFEDEYGKFSIKLVPSERNPNKIDRIDATVTGPGEDGKVLLVGKVVSFNDGSSGKSYVISGSATESGREGVVFPVPWGGGYASNRSIEYVEAALESDDVTMNLAKTVQITFEGN